jgi:hypothetical protein
MPNNIPCRSLTSLQHLSSGLLFLFLSGLGVIVILKQEREKKKNIIITWIRMCFFLIVDSLRSQKIAH